MSLIQVREKNISPNELKIFSKEIINICNPRHVKVIVNYDLNLAREIKADGGRVMGRGQGRVLRKRPTFNIHM